MTQDPSRPKPAIEVGTSGWSYEHWLHRFYPDDLPRSDWLAHYARHFRTVEVNSTFYGTPRLATVASWVAATPDDFVFAVKAPRFITHISRLDPPRESLDRFLGLLEWFGSKLGPVLFQLPPTFGPDPPVVERFLARLPSWLKVSFEFRHPGWLTEETLARFSDARATVVIADPAPALAGTACQSDALTEVELRAAIARAGTPSGSAEPGWVYMRFHGPYRGGPEYGKRRLRRWAESLSSSGLSRAFVYFNNDARGAAVRDALAFLELLRKE